MNAEPPVTVEPAPDRPLSLPEAVARRLGGVSLVDLTFPRCRYLGADAGPARVVGINDGASASYPFLTRFRQSGGHEPITTLDRSRFGTEVYRLLGEATASPVLAVESVEVARSLADLASDWPAALLFPDDGEGPDLPGFAAVTFERADGSGSYRLAVPGASGPSGPPVPERIAAVPAAALVFSAAQFLHDGGYQAEKDGSYSWLWTGPSPHFRLIVPRAPDRRARSAEICMVRTESPWTLDQLRVQIDGLHAPHRLERWSESSGKIVIALPPADDYTVVGVIVPAMDKDAYSGRPIGLCVDKLLLLPV